MIAIGVMNMAGSCTSYNVTTGSFSRSAVNANASAKTVVSNIIMASTVLVTLLFLIPLFQYTTRHVDLASVLPTSTNIPYAYAHDSSEKHVITYSYRKFLS
ncbi:hypothetical protein L1887_17604 [Cichorium endivia]|nr:hypothetical protein L1887_17604 [Cichorium endivia]